MYFRLAMKAFDNFFGSIRRRRIEPKDANDRAMLRMAEGATFRSTTMPSGWVTPDYAMIVRNGVLVRSE